MKTITLSQSERRTLDEASSIYNKDYSFLFDHPQHRSDNGENPWYYSDADMTFTVDEGSVSQLFADRDVLFDNCTPRLWRKIKSLFPKAS